MGRSGSRLAFGARVCAVLGRKLRFPFACRTWTPTHQQAPRHTQQSSSRAAPSSPPACRAIAREGAGRLCRGLGAHRRFAPPLAPVPSRHSLPCRTPNHKQKAPPSPPLGLVIGRGRNGGTAGRAGPRTRLADGQGRKGERSSQQDHQPVRAPPPGVAEPGGPRPSRQEPRGGPGRCRKRQG